MLRKAPALCSAMTACLVMFGWALPAHAMIATNDPFDFTRFIASSGTVWVSGDGREAILGEDGSFEVSLEGRDTLIPKHLVLEFRLTVPANNRDYFQVYVNNDLSIYFGGKPGEYSGPLYLDAWAGRIVDLRFSLIPDFSDPGLDSVLTLTNATTLPVPVPSGALLLFSGLTTLCRSAWRRRQSDRK